MLRKVSDPNTTEVSHAVRRKYGKTELVLWGASVLTLLAGCSSHNFLVMATTVPGKFDGYTCKQLPNLVKGNAADMKRIESAMGKASASNEGPAINFAVYSPRLTQLQTDRALLAEAFSQKRCQDKAE